MAKSTKSTDRFAEILEEYRRQYDVDSLQSPNDKANLTAFINIQILVEQLQSESERLAREDIIANIDMIQKINAAIEKQLERGLQLERALALDRKSRASDKADNVAQYLTELRANARDYLHKQFIIVYCPSCEIMVGRIIPVMEHSAFDCSFQCSQCRRKVTARRTERDLFFDFDPNDKAWRTPHAYKVIQPKKTKLPDIKSDPQLLIADEEDEENQDVNNEINPELNSELNEELNGTSEETDD